MPTLSLINLTIRRIEKWKRRCTLRVFLSKEHDVSSTLVEGKVDLWAAILSFRTHLNEIEVTLTVLERHAYALEENA